MMNPKPLVALNHFTVPTAMILYSLTVTPGAEKRLSGTACGQLGQVRRAA
jgi:hypothetical protein